MSIPISAACTRGSDLALDFSAFATLGKHAPHRGGFGQNIYAAYLAPLTRDGKFWGAAGIYFNNTTWGGDAYRDVGLYGILGYKINEKWELLCLWPALDSQQL